VTSSLAEFSSPATGVAGIRSEQSAKRFDGQASIPDDPTHRNRIDRVLPWNRHLALSVRHDDVLPLTQDAKTSFLQNPDRVQMIGCRAISP
jgi:hypothetical protein